MPTVSWIMPWGQMAWLRAYDDALARAVFDAPSSYVVGWPVPGYQCTPTRVYTSMDAYCQTGGSLVSGSLVAYDLEAWAASPMVDKQHPASSYAHFLSLAKARGHGVMATPGRDLVTVQGGDQVMDAGEDINAAYLRCGIPAACAGAHVLLVQSQGAQKDLAAFTSLISGAKAQQADPNQQLWCGLTTSTSTAAQMTAAWEAAQPMVHGCWVTIGGQAQASVAAGFFRAITP